MEKTLIILKPDAIQRELVGEVINILERKGLKIIGLKMLRLEEGLLNRHYSHISDKPFFKEIAEFMSSTPVICMVVEGVEAVNTVRSLTGETLSREAECGTIRGMFAMSIQCNIVHTSDSVESALKEINNFFKSEEIFSYEKITDVVIYSTNEKN